MMLDCNKYNEGEALVQSYLQDHGFTVIDVSKDQDYWIQDVDFIVVKGSSTEKVEVKYDSYINRTGSFFIELKADEKKNRPGWIDITKADWIYYVDAKSKACYVFQPDDMRKYLANNPYSVKRCYKDGYKVSCGAIVSIDDFRYQYPLMKLQLVSNKTV